MCLAKQEVPNDIKFLLMGCCNGYLHYKQETSVIKMIHFIDLKEKSPEIAFAPLNVLVLIAEKQISISCKPK